MKHAALLILLVLLVLLAGIATFETGLLVLAAPIMVYLISAVVFGPDTPFLVGTRELDSERAVPGQPVLVRVSLTNRGKRLEEVLLKDFLPPGVKLVEGDPLALTSLNPGQTLMLEYTLHGQRGFHQLPGVQAGVSDHLGLWRRNLGNIAPGTLVVLPQPMQLKRVAIRPQQTRLAPGIIPARRGGPGTDFFNVRGYAPGDSLRRINWRASARRDEGLYTNEFEQERAADVGIILDARRRVDVLGRGGSLFEYKVTAAATLAEALLRASNRVSLLVYGGLLDWTFPGYGKVQQEKILRVLAAAHTDESLIFDRIEYLPVRVFPSRSQILLISALHPEDLPFLVRLRALGYALSVISPDPVAYEAGQDFDIGKPGKAIALRLANLERNLLLNGLRQAGIQVLNWNVSIPFDQAAGTALSRRFADI